MERIMCAQKMKAMNGNRYALDERGLSIARELARAHGGDFTPSESREDWREFCLRLGRRLTSSAPFPELGAVLTTAPSAPCSGKAAA